MVVLEANKDGNGVVLVGSECLWRECAKACVTILVI